jgi:hypothetical protein
VNHIEELRDMIQRPHGGHATHVTSVPVKEMLQGRTLWEGVVEIFDLSDHP